MYTRPFLRSTRVILTAKFTDRAISPSPTVLSVTPPPEIRRGLFTKYIREIKRRITWGGYKNYAQELFLKWKDQ